MNPIDQAKEAFPPIERDETYNRDYIPIGAGYEVQTKGRGSSFRIAHKDDDNVGRINIPGTHFEFDYLERMARAIHAERAALEAEQSGPRARHFREAFLHWFNNIRSRDSDQYGAANYVEHHARELAEKEKQK